MGVLEFICTIMIVTIVAITIVGIVGMKYNTEKLEEENAKLKEDLHKLRARREKQCK